MYCLDELQVQNFTSPLPVFIHSAVLRHTDDLRFQLKTVNGGTGHHGLTVSLTF